MTANTRAMNSPEPDMITPGMMKISMMKTGSEPVIITGFMGAGKTTVAAALALLLKREMFDLDQFLTEREGRTPQVIIDESGETHFRERETVALHEILERHPSSIIALGGGTWTIERNRALIAQHQGLTIWLDAPFELCWQRINSTGHLRPFARERASAQQLFHERRALYQLADLHVEVNAEKSLDQLAAQIASALLV